MECLGGGAGNCWPVLSFHSHSPLEAMEEVSRGSLGSLGRNLEVKGRAGIIQLPRSSEKTVHLKRSFTTFIMSG